MKIALFGYGKMGKEIEKILSERGHEITHKVNSSNPKEALDFSSTEVVIEFSKPEIAVDNIIFCLKNHLPIIVGTTGWYQELANIEAKVKETNGSLLHATNFSLGVNLFFALNEKLAQLMNPYPDYECSITEIHHTEKLDVPSGTGISIAEQIIHNHNQYSNWENVEKSEITSPHILSLASERLPHIPGTHTVTYENEIDKIEITHLAHNRKGFALGSVIAAEWIKGKKGVYTMKNVLNL